MKAFIKSTKFGLKYRLDNSTVWEFLGDSVKTKHQIQQFFERGGHVRAGHGKHDPPEIVFVNHDDKPIREYTLRSGEGGWVATIDRDDTKAVVISADDLWNTSDRLQFLRENSISLPAETGSIDKALEYARASEPLLVEDYLSELEKRTGKEGVTEYVQRHSEQFHKSPANIVFPNKG
jgi:hypothetical protein